MEKMKELLDKKAWLEFCLSNTTDQINVIHLTGQIILIEEQLNSLNTVYPVI